LISNIANLQFLRRNSAWKLGKLYEGPDFSHVRAHPSQRPAVGPSPAHVAERFTSIPATCALFFYVVFVTMFLVGRGEYLAADIYFDCALFVWLWEEA